MPLLCIRLHPPVCKMPPFVLPFVAFCILKSHLLPCVIPYIMSEF